MVSHNGHAHARQVWVVYSVPEPPVAPIPLVLWTLPVPVDSTEPCGHCRRKGAEGPCPGVKAHAYAQHARLSLRTGIRPLEVGLFELPPHVHVMMCATHLYRLIVKRANENRPPANEGPGGRG
jgi:hypothetical protein